MMYSGFKLLSLRIDGCKRCKEPHERCPENVGQNRAGEID